MIGFNISSYPLQLRKLFLGLLFSGSLLISTGFFSAQAQAPTIASFTPASICQGDAVVITGTNLTGATIVKLGTANAASFIVNNSTTITAIAGAPSTGVISLTTPGGNASSTNQLTILPAPVPALTDISAIDVPFTNCDGNASYQITVSNSSTPAGGSSQYKIDWGDLNSTPFTQTDWPAGAQTSHTYLAQGYYDIVLTVTPANGCAKSRTYRFYNGTNPLASLTTTSSTTGLCVPAPIEFQVGNWFNNSAGTSYQLDFGDGSPNVTLQHPLNAGNIVQLVSHTYITSSCPSVDFVATLKAINGCFTTTYTLNQIIIRKKPTADFSTQPAPACINSPVCFTNLTTNGYSGNSCNTSSTYTWDFGDGISSTLATPPCHTYAAAGTYKVTLTASNTACGNDAISKDIVVKPASPPPVVSITPASYCQGQIASQLTATGTGLLWYSSATGGTGATTPPTPSTNLAGTFTYYVSQTITGNCESPRVPVTVVINPAPVAPVVSSPVQLCQNQTATPLTATGSGLLWYNSSTGGTGSATAPTPSTASVGNTTYYVSQTVNGCEGPRAMIIVMVNSLATAPVVTSPVIYCQNQPAIPLTATGSGLLWYTAATGGTGSATAPTPSTTDTVTTIYYVSQVTGCGEGPRASITVNVNPSPSASIVYGVTNLCNAPGTGTNPNPPVNVMLTGTAGGTFSITPATGLLINSATGILTPSGSVPGSYTIKYTINGSGGCPDFSTTTGVSVSASPTASINYPAIC